MKKKKDQKCIFEKKKSFCPSIKNKICQKNDVRYKETGDSVIVTPKTGSHK